MKTSACFLIALLGVMGSASGTTWYVDAANPTPALSDGSSWELAFPSISMAISVAGPRDEIWVAGGTYFESVVLKGDLSAYGGFVGAYQGLPGETLRDERNPTVNETVIDGSQARQGLPAFHVVIGNNNTVLDGFTIAGGVGNGGSMDSNGAGMRNLNLVNVVVANCKFVGNTAEAYGGAVYNENADVQVTGCIFTGNAASQGGGVYDRNGTVALTRCNFMVNRATQNGGALASVSTQGGPPQVIDGCAFSRNEAALYGGALFMNGGQPVIKNGLFRKNSADLGAALMNQGLDTVIELWNCTFLDNLPRLAAVINDEMASVVITNCILWDPQAMEEVHTSGTLTVSYSDVRAPGPEPLQGTGNINADPQFVRHFFSTTWPGGDTFLAPSSPCLNTGTADGAPGTDILGEPRPTVGASVDMGAHQHSAQPLLLDLPPILLLNADAYPISGTAPPESLVVITGGDEMSPDGQPRRPVLQQLGPEESRFNVAVPLRQNGVNMLTVTVLLPDGSFAAPVHCTLIEGDAFPMPPEGGGFPNPKALASLQIVPIPPYDGDGNVVFRCNAYYDGDQTPYDVTAYVTWDADDGNINHEGGRYIPGGGQTLITASFGGLQDSLLYTPCLGKSEKVTSHSVMSHVTNGYLVTALTGCSVKPGTYALTDCGAGNYSRLILDNQYTVSASKTSPSPGFLSISAPGQSNVGKTLKVNFALWPNDPYNPGVSTWSPGKSDESGGEKDSYYTVNTDHVTLIGSALGLDSYLKDVTVTITDPSGRTGTPTRILNALSPSLALEPYRLEPFLASQYHNGFYRADIQLTAGASPNPYKIEIKATNAVGGVTSHTVWVLYTTEPKPPFQLFSNVTGCGWHEEGSALVLEVTVQGQWGDLTYEWSKDGVDIIGATDAAYRVDAPTTADSGRYRCTATDGSTKAIIFIDFVVSIFPAGSLPVAGLIGLGALVTAVLGGGTVVLRKFRKV